MTIECLTLIGDEGQDSEEGEWAHEIKWESREDLPPHLWLNGFQPATAEACAMMKEEELNFLLLEDLVEESRGRPFAHPGETREELPNEPLGKEEEATGETSHQEVRDPSVPEWEPEWDIPFTPIVQGMAHIQFKECHPEFTRAKMWEQGPCPKGRCFQCREEGHLLSKCPNPALYEFCPRCGWPHERIEWCPLCAPKYWAKRGQTPPPRPAHMKNIAGLRSPSKGYIKWARRTEADRAQRRLYMAYKRQRELERAQERAERRALLFD